MNVIARDDLMLGFLDDDGSRSEGKTLADALAALGEMTIVAPMTEVSAIGHALTLRHPLRLDHTPNACSRLKARRPIA